jgi:hypothetical protein
MPSKVEACLAYGPTIDITEFDDVPNIVAIGDATRGRPPSQAPSP